MKVKISPVKHDPADIDSDGEFDAIDIAILEEENGVKQPQNRNVGCCLVLMVTGATFAGAVIALSHHLIKKENVWSFRFFW